MRTRLFLGIVAHTRFTPVKHSFRYGYPMVLLDLEETGQLARDCRFFGVGRRRFFTFDEDDYFIPGEGSLKARILNFLLKEGESVEGIDRVLLLTVPSFFGWGFNPVSFYFCVRDNGEIRTLLAEVNNTFKERHLYILSNSLPGHREGFFESSTEKVFHVSPFFEKKGEYHFNIAAEPDRLQVGIAYHCEGRRLLTATLEGHLVPFSQRNLNSLLLRHPFVRLLTTARIYIQAARLYFKDKLPVTPKPEPTSPHTYPRTKFGATTKLSQRLLWAYLEKIQEGNLTLSHPDGSTHRFGSEGFEPDATIRVLHPRFYRRTLFGGDIGFGEAYMDGDWTSEDLPGLFRFLIRNREAMREYTFGPSEIIRGLSKWTHRLRSNHPMRSRKNVSAHYDLDNRFFQMFLDPSMTYSCAYFPDDRTSLEEAQVRKIDLILDRAEIEPHSHVLEIGTGWGALAQRLATRKGCHVSSVTLSKEQFDYSTDLMRRSALEERVHIDFKDYREVTGLFDRIVSVEMLEAVGQKHLPTFFRQCQNLLKADGRLVLQVITISDHYYESYRKGKDWIQKHIFPGGFLPSTHHLETVIEAHTDFVISHIEDIGLHYGTTIRRWRDRFLRNREKILDLGFDERFQRKWLYYFAYCEAAFDTRTLGVQQIVLQRRGD